MDAVLQEQLPKWRRANRRLFFFGWGLLACVILSWVFLAVYIDRVQEFLLRPGTEELLILRKIDTAGPLSAREKKMMDVTKTLIIAPRAILKVLTIRFAQTLAMVLGFFAVGFAVGERRKLNLLQKMTETK